MFTATRKRLHLMHRTFPSNPEPIEGDVLVRMGEGGRIENPVRWPKCDTHLENDNMFHDYTNSCDYWFKERFIDPSTLAITGRFNGPALEYFYTHLICPWFNLYFHRGHMESTLRDNYKTLIPDRIERRLADGQSFDTDSDAYNTCMHFNRLFEGDHGNKGQIEWIKKIRVLEEASRDSAPGYAYQDGELIFPTRYCFNVIFPVYGNEGIILRLRLGGMVKQRDD